MIGRILHHIPRTLVITAACLWAALTMGCADRATPPQAQAPVATIVSVEGTSTTYHTRDWNGKQVTVRVPSQSVADIKDRDADGTVRATITSIDPSSQRVRVRTAEGQTVVLAMAPGAIVGLKPGDHVIFTLPGTPRT